MNKGQSLFEVVVALAISALIITAIVSLVSNSIRNATFSRNKTLAARYAQEATEWLRGQRDSDMTTFSANILTPTWCFKSLSWVQSGNCASDDFIPATPLIREVTFSVGLVGGKDLVQSDVVVFWTDSQGYHEVRSATNFADWRQR
jgi:Tfp pilus assembly protein PilV